MKRNAIETVLGAVVLVIALMFLVFAYSTADIGVPKGYQVKAIFLKVGGLEKGSDVRIGGVPVGSVTGQFLDTHTFEANVSMSISADVRLPEDTEVSIVSEGLLGGKYVSLKPGTSTSFVNPNGILKNTRDYQSLEDLVGEIIFLATQDSDSGSD